MGGGGKLVGAKDKVGKDETESGVSQPGVWKHHEGQDSE